MLSQMDECLEEIRKAFEQLDHWIHVPFFEFLAQIPKGNENDLYDLADAWGKASGLYSGHSGDVRNASNDLFTVWSGDGAAQSARNTMDEYAKNVDDIAKAMGQMQGSVQSAGLGIETNKYMAIINLILLLITLIEAIATLIVTLGASALEGAGAVAVCREALQLAFKELLKKLASLATKEGWQTLAKLGLKSGLQFVAFTVATKVGITGIEAIEGHMTLADLKSEAEALPAEVVDSFFTGFIGGQLSLGMHGALPEALSMGGGQIADNAFVKLRNQIFGNAQWAKQWGITNDGTGWLTGVGTSALFGGVMGGLGGMKELPEALGSRRASLDLRDLGLTNDPGGLADSIANTATDPLGDSLADPAGDPSASGDSLSNTETGGADGLQTSNTSDTSTHTSADTQTVDQTETNGQGTTDGQGADSGGPTTSQDATSSHDPTTTQDMTGSGDETGSGANDAAPGTHDTDPTATTDQNAHPDDGGTDAGSADTKAGDGAGTGDTTPPGNTADASGDHTTDAPSEHTGADSTGNGGGGDTNVASHDPTRTDSTGSDSPDTHSTATDSTGGSHDAKGGDSSGTDTSRSDQTSGKQPTESKPRFFDWKQRIRNAVDHAAADHGYQARIAHEFAGHSAKDPVTLSRDTIQHVVDLNPKDLDPFGRRLRTYIEDHFTTRDETGALVALDDAAIRTTLHTLAGFLPDKPASEPGRGGQRSEGDPEDEPSDESPTATSDDSMPPEDRPADEVPADEVPADTESTASEATDTDTNGTEPTDTDAPGTEPTNTHSTDGVPTDGVPTDERPTAEPESGDADAEETWVSAADRSQPRTGAEWGKQLLGKVLERGADADRPDFRPGDPVSDSVVDRARHIAERVAGLNLKPLHGDAERLSRYVLDNLTTTDGEGTAHALDIDAMRQKLTDLYGDRTVEDHEPSLVTPSGEARMVTESYDHLYIQREPTDNAAGQAQITAKNFTSLRLGFDKFEEDFNSPEAVRATHDAARALADALHDTAVDGMRKWLMGDENKPPSNVGHTATAVMLRDGTVRAASSTRESSGSGRGSRFTADTRPDGATPRNYDVLRNEILHPLVKSVYDEIPERMRSLFAGRCGEPTLISALAHELETPFREAYVREHGAAGFDDLSPEDKADYAQQADAYLRQKIAGAHIVSYHGEGPDQGREQYPCESDDVFIEKLGMSSDYIERIGGQLLVDKANGLVIFAGEGDPLREVATTLASARDGSITVVGHGDGTSIAFGDEKLGPVEVNRVLDWVFREYEIDKPDGVSLVACVPDSDPHTMDHASPGDASDGARGAGRVGRAAEPLGSSLARRMDTDVVAARRTVWVSNRGRLITAPADAEAAIHSRTADASEPWTKYLKSGGEESVAISDYVGPSGIRVDPHNALLGDDETGHGGPPNDDTSADSRSDGGDEIFVRAGLRRSQPEPWVADYETAAGLHESDPGRAMSEIQRIIDEHGLRDGMPGAEKRYTDLRRFLSEPAHRLLNELRGVQHDADPARAMVRKMLNDGDLLDRGDKAETSPVEDPTGALRDVYWVHPKGWARQWRIGFTVEIESGHPAGDKMVDVIGTDVGQHFKIIVRSDLHDPAELGHFSALRTHLTAALEDRIDSESERASEGNSAWIRRTKAGVDFGGTAVGSGIADLLGDAALTERPIASALTHLITQGHFSRAAKLADARTDHLKALVERSRIDRIGPDALSDSVKGLDDDIRTLASKVGVDPSVLEERPPDDPPSSPPPPSGPPPEPGEAERLARELVETHRDAITNRVPHIEGIEASSSGDDLRVEVPRARDPEVTFTVGETDGPYSVKVAYDGNRHFTFTVPEDMLRPDADPDAVSQGLAKAFEKVASKQWELDAKQDSAATVGSKAGTALATQAINVASGEAKSVEKAHEALDKDTHHQLNPQTEMHQAIIDGFVPAEITLGASAADAALAPLVGHDANTQAALRKEHDAAQQVLDVPKAQAAAAAEHVRRGLANTLRIVRFMNHRDGRGSDPAAPDATAGATPIESAHTAMRAVEEANRNLSVTIEESSPDPTTTRYVIRHSALNTVTLDIKEGAADADRPTLELHGSRFTLTIGGSADPAQTARITHELAQTIIDKRAQVDSIPEELRRMLPSTTTSALTVTATSVISHNPYGLAAVGAAVAGKAAGMMGRHILGTRLADRGTEHAIAVLAPGDVTAADLRSALHDLSTEVEWQEGKTRELLTDHIEKIDQDLADPDISAEHRSQLSVARREATDYLDQIPKMDHEILEPVENGLQQPDLGLPYHASIKPLDADNHLYQLTADSPSAATGIPSLGGSPRASRTIELVTDDGGGGGDAVRIRRTNADTHLTVLIDRTAAASDPDQVLEQVKVTIRGETEALHGNHVRMRTTMASAAPSIADAALTSGASGAVGLAIHASQAALTGGTSLVGAVAGAVVDQAAGRSLAIRRADRTALFDALAKLRTAKPTPERTAIFAGRTSDYIARLQRVSTVRSWLERHS